MSQPSAILLNPSNTWSTGSFRHAKNIMNGYYPSRCVIRDGGRYRVVTPRTATKLGRKILASNR